MNLAKLKENRCPNCGSQFIKMVKVVENNIVCVCGYVIPLHVYRKTAVQSIYERTQQEQHEEIATQ